MQSVCFACVKHCEFNLQHSREEGDRGGEAGEGGTGEGEVKFATPSQTLWGPVTSELLQIILTSHIKILD